MLVQTEIALYLSLGLIAVLVNSPVICAVFLTAQLRQQKEFVIIVGLCLTDAINGLVFVIIGIYRWTIVRSNNFAVLTSRLSCLSTVPQMSSVGIDQAFAWMLLVVTADRFFAVFAPIRYFRQNHLYPWKMLLAVVLQSVFCVAVAFFFTRDFTFPEVSSLCYTSDSVNPKLYRILEVTRLSTVSFSVLLYVPICSKLYYISRNRQGIYSTSRYQQLKNMTITVALASATSVVLVLMPDAAVVFDLFGLQKFASYFFSVTILKSSINVFIYVVRNPLIYRTIRGFFCSRPNVPIGSVQRSSSTQPAPSWRRRPSPIA
ncbi:hypothetical protein QR680_012345 [Steinernema hermaphroditum]|uniref:G-protein coupled receptors family 1 profile domain-containing protein n=1 Tax=Steinernema hermaphroditum TaxID=289476 RepID=A0AA39LZP9_9BILA|nr:hypothetical protein QR680_012345 [Steinernema hermaphroditum]